jgi:hypothetical protein
MTLGIHIPLSSSFIPAIITGNGRLDFSIFRITDLMSLISVAAGVFSLVSINKKFTATFIPLYSLFIACLGLIINKYGVNVVSRYYLHTVFLVFILMASALTEKEFHLSRYTRMIGLILMFTYICSGTNVALTRERIHLDLRSPGIVIRRQIQPDELLVVMASDGFPVQLYLEASTPILSGYDLENKLREGSQMSYMILETPLSGKIELKGSIEVLYETPSQSVRVLRYVPES